MQSQQLPTKSQVFEDEVLAGTESAGYPAEEMSERHDHGKNFSGKDRIKLCAKSFISQVYDVLAAKPRLLSAIALAIALNGDRPVCGGRGPL